jgi:hypothetical protein
VSFAVGGGHEHRDVAAQNLGGGVAEQALRRRIEEFDEAPVADGDDAVDGGGDDGAEPLLAGLQFGRAFPDAPFERPIGVLKLGLRPLALLDFPLQQGILLGQFRRARLDLMFQFVERFPEFLAHRPFFQQIGQAVRGVHQVGRVVGQGRRIGDAQNHEAVQLRGGPDRQRTDFQSIGGAAGRRSGQQRESALIRQDTGGVGTRALRDPQAQEAKTHVGQPRNLLQGAPDKRDLFFPRGKDFDGLLQDQQLPNDAGFGLRERHRRKPPLPGGYGLIARGRPPVFPGGRSSGH